MAELQGSKVHLLLPLTSIQERYSLELMMKLPGKLSLPCVGPWKTLPPKKMTRMDMEEPGGRDWIPLGFTVALLNSVHPLNCAARLGSHSVWSQWQHHGDSGLWLHSDTAGKSPILPEDCVETLGHCSVLASPEGPERSPHVGSAELDPIRAECFDHVILEHFRQGQRRCGFKTGIQSPTKRSSATWHLCRPRFLCPCA